MMTEAILIQIGLLIAGLIFYGVRLCLTTPLDEWEDDDAD